MCLWAEGGRVCMCVYARACALLLCACVRA